MISIREIMTTELETLSADDTLAAASHLMAERGIRHIPIVDGNGSLAGLVTQSDVLAASQSSLSAEASKHDPGAIKVADFMTKNVATVDERANLREAALYLRRHKFGCLPIVTDGELRGIVTDTDFVDIAINLLEQIEMTEPEEL